MLLSLLVLFAIFLVAGVPLAYVFSSSSFISILATGKVNPILMIQKLFTSMDSFTYMAIPLYLLAGSIMNETGITKKLVALADSLVGQFYGGLAQTTALSGMLMAGISGSSNADATAIGALMLPPLREAGYDDGFRVSLVSACAVLGPIIPPSILMIVYAGVSTVPIGDLFMAGVIPGVSLGIIYMMYSWLYARQHNIPRTKFKGWGNVGHCFVSALGGLVMPIIIIGGILGGIVTATEAGILAVIYGIIYGFVTRQITLKVLGKCVKDSLNATVASVLVIAFANLIGLIFTRANLPTLMKTAMTGLTSNVHVILLLIIMLELVLGMFIDANAIILMMVPIFAPLMQSLNVDPVWFAMVFILAVDTGGLTPPVGLVMYIVAGIENTSISHVVKKIWVFVCSMMIVDILIIFFPQMALWIPQHV